MISSLAKRLIEVLNTGSQPARDELLLIEEFLRKGWSSGFTSIFEEVEAAGVTSDDAGAVREALYEAFRREIDPTRRRDFLLTLSRFGGAELRDSLIRELHLAFEVHRVASGVLWSTLWALDNVGESVFPENLKSRGIDQVEDNIKAAQDYLAARGIVVPLQRRKEYERTPALHTIASRDV